MASLLSATILLPLGGALLLGRNRQTSRRVALFVALLALASAIVLLVNRPGGDRYFAAVAFNMPGESGLMGQVRCELSLDELSSWLFALTTLVSASVVLLGWNVPERRTTAFYRLLLLLESSTLATLAAGDAILFCFFCELTLLVLMLIVGTGGGQRAHTAAVRFISMSTLGSGLVLLGLLAMASWHFRHGPAATVTFSIPRLITALVVADDWAAKAWICLSMAVGLAVIGAQFHWHGWARGGLEMAKADRSPTAYRVIVSGVVLELCAYGLLRFVRPILVDTVGLTAALRELVPSLLHTEQAGRAATVVDVATTPDVLTACGRWLPWLLGGLLLPLFLQPAGTRSAAARAGLLLAAIAGTAMAIVADDLVRMFLAVEIIAVTVGLLLYIDGLESARPGGEGESQPRQWLASYQRMNSQYLLPSILASAMLLGGFVLLHAAIGSTRLPDITASQPRFVPFVKIAVALVLAALGFRMAAVPMHFHFPRILEQSNYASGALLSVISKTAGLVVLARLLSSAAAMPHAGQISVWPAVGLLSAVTMCWGSAMALRQDHLRPLLAYASMAQTGLMLMALVAESVRAGTLLGDFDPTAAMLFCLYTYSIAMIGTLAVLTHLRREDRSLRIIDELAGLGRGRPLAAAAMALFMLSMAGISPLAGFWAKALLLGGLLGADIDAGQGWLVALAVVGVLNFAAMTACYMRIVAIMYFRTPLAIPKPHGGMAAWCVALVCAALLLAAGFGLGIGN